MHETRLGELHLPKLDASLGRRNNTTSPYAPASTKVLAGPRRRSDKFQQRRLAASFVARRSIAHGKIRPAIPCAPDAFGGGCEITEAVHLAIASETAIFAKPEIAIGIPPTFGGTQRLARLAGRKRALEYLLTGDTFSPQRACELGVVNHVVPPDQLMTSSFDLGAAHPAPFAVDGRSHHFGGDARAQYIDCRGIGDRERAIRPHGADARPP